MTDSDADGSLYPYTFGRSKVVTVKDIAEMCGVSPSTVSNVLNGKNKVGEEVRQRVLEAVEQTGYQPNFFAQGIRKLKTRTIGIIVEDLCQFTSPHIVETILDYLEQHGYKTVLMNLRMYYRWKKSHLEDTVVLNEALKSVLQQMQAIKVDGIIYVAAHTRVMNVMPKDYPIPTVFAYGYEDREGVPSVIIDDEASSYELVSYMIGQGHKKIGIIGGAEDNFHTKARLKGLQHALFDAGIPFDPSSVRYGTWVWESGYELSKVLLKNDYTALWCMNDRMASGAYVGARELGLEVGRDVAIAGFDDHELASSLYPTLTTSKLPLYDIGYKAAILLVDMLENGDSFEMPESPIRMRCQMVVRNSVNKI